MKGQSPSSYFTRDVVAGFHNRYNALMASLHGLSLEMESKRFSAPVNREWTHRSIAVSSAVRALIDGQKVPRKKASKYQTRGEITADEYTDEELS